MTRHENRFGITSFIYRARLPFHPGRLYDYFLDPFFIFHGSRKEEIEETSKLEKLQKDAGLKQERRTEHLGGLMRSKGFVWIATSQYFMGAWQQAGNVLRVKPNRPWLCEVCMYVWNFISLIPGYIIISYYENFRSDTCGRDLLRRRLLKRSCCRKTER